MARPLIGGLRRSCQDIFGREEHGGPALAELSTKKNLDGTIAVNADGLSPPVNGRAAALQSQHPKDYIYPHSWRGKENSRSISFSVYHSWQHQHLFNPSGPHQALCSICAGMRCTHLD